jgi:hypothetical protein
VLRDRFLERSDAPTICRYALRRMPGQCCPVVIVCALPDRTWSSGATMPYIMRLNWRCTICAFALPIAATKLLSIAAAAEAAR